MPQQVDTRRDRLILKVIIPVLIGLGVVIWLFYDEFNMEVWRSFTFNTHVIVAMTAALICVFGRDLGMAWRFHTITDNHLGWIPSARVTLLCEFTSAITPTAVGGSALGMVFLNREGIELGRATTLMMTTIFLDELFLVIALPFIFLIAPYRQLFGFDPFEIGLRAVFWVIYGGIAAWTLLLFTGIFIKPHVIGKWLKRLFRFKLLRRWYNDVVTMTDNMETTGHALRKQSRQWWSRAFGATALSWISRFLVVNALIWGFAPYADQLIVFGRQFVVWVILMVSPTPGGSGLSEWLFTKYYGDLIHNESVTLVIALFWRIISYYIYLILGICVIPSWLKHKSLSQTHHTHHKSQK